MTSEQGTDNQKRGARFAPLLILGTNESIVSIESITTIRSKLKLKLKT